MSDEIKSLIEKQGAAIDAAIQKHDGQIQENGKASKDALDAVKSLSEKFEASITELAQKMEKASEKGAQNPLSAGEEFVNSAQYKSFLAGDRDKARVEVKNTVTSAATTVFPQQNPGIIQGNFAPVSIR